MAYNLKDVFYIGATHEYLASTYGSASIQGNIPIDISAYVDPIAKGRAKGQGLAIYKVHYQVSGDTAGGPQDGGDGGAVTFGLTVKPYADSGDNSGELNSGDLMVSSDLAIFLCQYNAPVTIPPYNGMKGTELLQPSTEVPYVCVRDTIFQIIQSFVGLTSSDNLYISYRMECALVTLDTATLNQLLRTQTA